jgi:hypothetical protein
MQRENVLYLIGAINRLEKKTRVNYQIIDKSVSTGGLGCCA